jgi:integrase
VCSSDLTIGHEPSGKSIRKSFYGTSERAVNDKIKEYYKQSSAGTIDKSITLAEWADKWLETYKEENVRGNTYISSYKIPVDKIKKYFSHAKLAGIRSVDIQTFFNSMSSASQSQLDKLKITLNGIFKAAIENELIVRNPVSGVRPRSEQKPDAKRVYSREEATGLVRFAKTHKDGAAIITILKTGLRRGEMCGLRWTDVDFKTATIHVRNSVYLDNGRAKIDKPKTATSIRDIPFDEELADVLHKIPRMVGCQFVFYSPRGKMLNPDNWHDRVYVPFMNDYGAATPDARILTLHELRHTFGTFLYEATGDIYITSVIMGHSSPNVTAKIYVHEHHETRQAAMAKVLPFT